VLLAIGVDGKATVDAEEVSRRHSHQGKSISVEVS